MENAQGYTGIDVGRDWPDIATPRGAPVATRRILNTVGAINAHLDGLAHFIFEATGAYHPALAYLLDGRGLPFTMADPLASKGFARSLVSTAKTGRADAAMLLRFGRERRPAPTVLPGVAGQRFRQELADWQACLQQLGRERNRLHALLAWEHSSPAAVAAVRERAALLEEQAAQWGESLLGAALADGPAVGLAATVKGTGRKTALWLVCLSGGLGGFQTPAQLAKFAGLAPVVRQSGRTVGRGAAGKRGNAVLRSLPYMCARPARRSDPACKQPYERLRAKGKAHKVCMVAVAHKLLRQFFAVLKSGKPYDPAMP
jgi:transposase